MAGLTEPVTVISPRSWTSQSTLPQGSNRTFFSSVANWNCML